MQQTNCCSVILTQYNTKKIPLSNDKENLKAILNKNCSKLNVYNNDCLKIKNFCAW